MASAWTSFTGRPCVARQRRAILELRRRIDDPPVAPGQLEADRPERRVHRDDLTLQALPLDLVVPQPDGRRLAEDDVRQRWPAAPAARRPSAACRAGSSSSGPASRTPPARRRAYSRSIATPNSCGFMSSISHSMTVDPLGRRGRSAARPISMRRTFGVPGLSRLPAAVADLLDRHRRHRPERRARRRSRAAPRSA